MHLLREDDPELISELDGAIVTEGVTDWIAGALWAVRLATSGTGRFAVFGIAAGGAPALAEIEWPRKLPCIIATDDDSAGNAYAAQIQAALPSHVRVERMTFGGVK